VDLAAATNSTLIGFNVKPDAGAQRAAERAGVEIRTYNIIYDLTADVEKAMKGMLTPIYEESPLGKAEVRQNFRTPKAITIAGSYVTEGKLVRGGEVRLRRGTELLYTGKIDTLRRVKDDVREVAQGFECGITLHDFNEEYKPGDILECFEMKQVERA
jgi:translation initiation factor IF-2